MIVTRYHKDFTENLSKELCESYDYIMNKKMR